MDRPLRVLHAVVNMNRGGAETMIMNLYRNIDRTKIQFDFLTSKEGVFDEEIRQMGGRIHRIPYVTEAGPIRYFFLLKKFFNENNYTIVHAHMDKMSGQILAAAKQAGVPVRIAHSHGTKNEGKFSANLYKNLSGLLVNRSSNYKVACSTEAAKFLYGTEKLEVKVVNNGIDPIKYRFDLQVRANTRKKLDITEDTVLIGHVGRFQKPKNHSFILQIFNELLRKGVNAKLALAGDGEAKKDIELQAKKMGIYHHIYFLGVIDQTELLYPAFDVMVFPSLHEGLPLSLIEAQYCNLNCLVSEHVSTDIDLGEGLITFLSIENPSIWAQQIKTLHEQKIVRSQVKTSTKFDINHIAEKVIDIYRNGLIS
ncbi:glycosyltransferase family 1 protein [Jeotgalibacillus malaysiensis]|uniref:glycosyltransferase family 1 protein n=1 Tax=Jeotgalibacillus malaysiensis TaxID=1508404 RepID=UPI00384E7E33